MSYDKNPFVVTAVSGTAGTADTTGTAEDVALGANPDTGALYVQDLSGASGTTTVQMVSGTLNVGTVVVSSSSGGTNVNVNTGTINVGTFVLPTGTITTGSLTNLANLVNGSINVLTGTLQSSGTTTGVGVVSNLTNGSINILTGTIQSSGTTTGVGVVSNLTNGSVNILTGTLAVSLGTVGGKAASGAAAVANPVQVAGTDSGGTIYSPLVTTGGILSAVMPTGTVTTIAAGTQNTLGTVGVVNNLVTGTIAAVTSVTNLVSGTLLNSGTTTGVGVVSGLTTGTITTIVAGTQNTLGTVGVVNNLVTGTIAAVTSVTNLAGGTVQINPVPVPTVLSFGTLGTAGGSFFATISAASGAGTKHYISNVDIVVSSGTADVRVLTGTAIQGTGVLAAGWFGPAGGIAKNFNPAFATGTNSEITYHFVGAGTAFITVNYWKGA